MIYFFPYLILLVSTCGMLFSTSLSPWLAWAGFGFLFLFIPLFEYLFRNIKFQSQKNRSSFSDFSVLLMPFALAAVLVFCFWRLNQTNEAIEIAGLIASTGALVGGFGITSAHELVHRRKKWMRSLGVFNLMLVNFAHWGLEHVFGHHKTVATPADPASARRNENVYAFWARTYPGVLLGAWKISKYKVLVYWGISFLVSLFLLLFFGTKILLSWWAISIVATLLLQTVDYIEHYGLGRQMNQDGFYTAFKAHHAWDSTALVTNITLFNLGFHSHHHMKAALHFQDLTAQPNGRSMPFGYSVMIWLALIPSIYIPMMNRRIEMNG